MIEIWLPGRGIGKARPRFGNRGRIHTCDRYGQWKTHATLHILSLKLPPAPVPAKVECLFVNFFSSDSDNLIGSVLDALVQAEVLHNDSSSYVVECSGRFVKIRKRREEEKLLGILVRINSAQIEYLDSSIFREKYSSRNIKEIG